MASLLPVVKLMIACEDIILENNNISLIRLIGNVRPHEFGNYPSVMEQFCVFVSLCEARGQGRFAIRVVRADTDEVVYHSPVFVHSFGNDPLRVYGLPFRLHNCYFPAAGLYWMQFWFNGSVVRQEELFLR